MKYDWIWHCACWSLSAVLCRIQATVSSAKGLSSAGGSCRISGGRSPCNVCSRTSIDDNYPTTPWFAWMPRDNSLTCVPRIVFFKSVYFFLIGCPSLVQMSGGCLPRLPHPNSPRPSPTSCPVTPQFHPTPSTRPCPKRLSVTDSALHIFWSFVLCC